MYNSVVIWWPIRYYGVDRVISVSPVRVHVACSLSPHFLSSIYCTLSKKKAKMLLKCKNDIKFLKVRFWILHTLRTYYFWTTSYCRYHHERRTFSLWYYYVYLSKRSQYFFHTYQIHTRRKHDLFLIFFYCFRFVGVEENATNSNSLFCQ